MRLLRLRAEFLLAIPLIPVIWFGSAVRFFVVDGFRAFRVELGDRPRYREIRETYITRRNQIEPAMKNEQESSDHE